MRFGDLPLTARLMICGQTVLAAACLRLGGDVPFQEHPYLLGLLLAFGVVAGICKVETGFFASRITMGFTICYFTLLQMGPADAILVGALSILAGRLVEVVDRRPVLRPQRFFSVQTLFNLSNCVVSTAVVGFVYEWLGGTYDRLDLERLPVPFLGSVLAAYVCNVGVAAGMTATARRENVLHVFWKHYSWAWPGYLASASLGVAVLWAYQVLPVGPLAIIFLPLAYLVYYSYAVRSGRLIADMEHMRELNRLNDAIISALARAIDAKDQTTQKHLNRVREYALGLAERAGIPADDIQAIRIAALLHDVGKIGIPEQILTKAGKLTSEEFEVMKSHVEIGAQILDPVQFPWPVVPVVRAHHERWDGLGYPNGLSGAEIPVGARILSIVDVFDALTSERPYRRAIPREQAIDILRQNAGGQFDPDLVEQFITVLPELEARIAELEREEIAHSPPLPKRASMPPEPTAEDDAVLYRELADLLLVEPRLDVLVPRLAERLQSLVPFTALALFLRSPCGTALRARWASGMNLYLVQDLEIRMGEGVSGHAAATGQPWINAPAGQDLSRRLRPGENLEVSSAMAVPVIWEGEVIGVLTVYSSSYNMYRDYHRRRLAQVADSLAAYLLAERTGVPSQPLDIVVRLHDRSSLLQSVRQQISLARSREEELAFVLLRIVEPARSDAAARFGDDFEGGNRGLMLALRECIREWDVAGRLSADRLALVLPRCDERLARRIAARLRTAVGARTCNEVEVDVAIRLFPRDGATAEALLELQHATVAERVAVS